MRPAIVLSGSAVGLAVARALGRMGVPVAMVRYEDDDFGHVSRYVRECIPAPGPEASPDGFVERLIDHAQRFDRGVLIPASDETVVAVSEHKDVLDDHYIVACTGWEITKLFIEKKHTYALAEAVGVPAPRTIVPTSVEDVERYGETVEYPCLVKPSQSHLFELRFDRKMVRVGNLEQMLAAYRRAAEAGLEVMLQEIIPGGEGDGVNYNSYVWDGEPLAEFTARKLRNSPPRTGSPRVAVSERIPEIVEPGRRLLRAMGYQGFSNTEFKKDARDGVYKLMEVNGRHNLSSALAIRCGINFPWLQYRHLVEGELPSAGDFETGVYWTDLFRDVKTSVRYFGRERFPLADYVRPYVSPHVDAVLDRSDPKPFVERCRGLIGRATSSTRTVLTGSSSASA